MFQSATKKRIMELEKRINELYFSIEADDEKDKHMLNFLKDTIKSRYPNEINKWMAANPKIVSIDDYILSKLNKPEIHQKFYEPVKMRMKTKEELAKNEANKVQNNNNNNKNVVSPTQTPSKRLYYYFTVLLLTMIGVNYVYKSGNTVENEKFEKLRDRIIGVNRSLEKIDYKNLMDTRAKILPLQAELNSLTKTKKKSKNSNQGSTLSKNSNNSNQGSTSSKNSRNTSSQGSTSSKNSINKKKHYSNSNNVNSTDGWNDWIEFKKK